MSDSSTTESTETAPLSAEGRQWQSVMSGLILSNLDQSGYDLTPTEVTEYEDKSKADSLKNQIDGTQAQIDALKADIEANPVNVMMTGGKADPRTAQLSRLQQQKYNQQNELNGLASTTYTKYEVNKRPDARVQAAIDKYGEGSAEAIAAQDTVKQEEIDQATSMASVKRDYVTKLQKFINGDMSYTDEQAAQVEKYVAPIRDIVNKTANDLLTKYQDDDVALHEELVKIGKAIDQTGFDTQSALEAAQVQVEKSGETLMGVLENVNKSTEAKFKFQQDLLFDQIDKNVASQAAMLGLPPGSAAENYQKAKLKSDTFTALQLQLQEQEMKGKLGIQTDVEAGKKQISLSKVALAASQGEKKENLAGMDLSITSATKGKEETLKSATGQALVGLEQNKQNALQNLAFGGIPQMLGVAQTAQAANTNQAGAQQQQNIAGMGTVGTLLAPEIQRQTTEATTTRTSSPSFLDTFSGLVGLGTGVAGTVMSGGAGAGSSALSNMFSTSTPGINAATSGNYNLKLQ